MLTREQRLHAKWCSPDESTAAASHGIDDAGNASPPRTHQLERRSRRAMDLQWQRELAEFNSPRERWYTGTPAAELTVDHSLTLSSGAKVKIFSQQKGLATRNNSLVMYYSDTSARRDRVQLLFSTVVVLYKDPGDLMQWAGITKWRSVRPASSVGPPRPRMFDQDDTSMLWISVTLIVDVVGAAQVYYRTERSVQKCLYIVDKHCYSDVDTPQDVARIGAELAAMY